MEIFRSITVENTASNARDFCFLERNFLSHIKLALLFSVLSSSILLHARLVPDATEELGDSAARIPLASIQFAASLFAIAGGVWEYYHGFRDLMDTRAFLDGTKPHFAVMTVIVGVVMTTCVLLLADEKHI